MSKHTPGPFSARYDHTITVRDKDDNQLAICTHMLTKTGGCRDTNEVEKNAKLFAAAPDMAEALREILFQLTQGEKVFDRDDCITQARNAYAKAT